MMHMLQLIKSHVIKEYENRHNLHKKNDKEAAFAECRSNQG